jgi:serine/threonine protein kinase
MTSLVSIWPCVMPLEVPRERRARLVTLRLNRPNPARAPYIAGSTWRAKRVASGLTTTGGRRRNICAVRLSIERAKTRKPVPPVESERSVRERLYARGVEVAAVPRRAGHGPCDAAQVGRMIGGRYRLLERLGAGGMATVYRAKDERLCREVAVKLIADRLAREPLFVRRFRREAQLCGQLTHPNIVAVWDRGVTPRDFIVMELVPGLDAGRLLHREGGLIAGEAVHVVAQVCEALTYAHEHDVIHQDVSPGNILIAQPDWGVKLIDFGLASDSHDAAARRGTAGTPLYVAPELLHGAGATPRSDLYALGMVTYRLLGGPVYLPPADPEATVPLNDAARCAPLVEAHPRLPAALVETVERAVAEDPERRQESVAAFRDELLAALSPAERLPAAGRSDLPSAA